MKAESLVTLAQASPCMIRRSQMFSPVRTEAFAFTGVAVKLTVVKI